MKNVIATFNIYLWKVTGIRKSAVNWNEENLTRLLLDLVRRTTDVPPLPSMSSETMNEFDDWDPLAAADQLTGLFEIMLVMHVNISTFRLLAWGGYNLKYDFSLRFNRSMMSCKSKQWSCAFYQNRCLCRRRNRRTQQDKGIVRISKRGRRKSWRCQWSSHTHVHDYWGSWIR